MHPFKILSDPIRLSIVSLLCSGERNANVIADVVGDAHGIGRTAVSHQLRALREEGFVNVRIDHRWRYYRLAPDALDRVAGALTELYDASGGDPAAVRAWAHE